MRFFGGAKAEGRAVLVASLALVTTAGVVMAATPTSADPAGVAPARGELPASSIDFANGPGGSVDTGVPVVPVVVEAVNGLVVPGPPMADIAGGADGVRGAGGVAPGPAPAPAPVPAPAPAPVPAPADVVDEVGSWFAHGYTLELRGDGTGTFAVWHGAFDGNRISLSLIPAPGAATVAEVTAIETIGAGALGPDELPGVGGLVTITFGDAGVGGDVHTAHIEWTSGANRHAADLCPASGLDAAAMTALSCGA